MHFAVMLICWGTSVAVSLVLVRVIYGDGSRARPLAKCENTAGPTGAPRITAEDHPATLLVDPVPALSGS